ncbi:MAG: hypothetical protein JJV97_04780 [SAR324 cluster bacterium]|nr:hypothetical protein [SAR324 cluster bacterium]
MITKSDNPHPPKKSFLMMRDNFLKDIKSITPLVRLGLGMLLFLMLINYDYYHPSFFDQFSVPHQSPYIFGIAGALFISIFYDWLGFFSYLVPIFILTIRFDGCSYKRSIYYGIVLIGAIVALGGILNNDKILLVKFFGGLGYSASALVGDIWWIKAIAILLLLAGVIRLIMFIRLYKESFAKVYYFSATFFTLMRIFAYQIIDFCKIIFYRFSNKYMAKPAKLVNYEQSDNSSPKDMSEHKDRACMGKEELNKFLDDIPESTS